MHGAPNKRSKGSKPHRPHRKARRNRGQEQGKTDHGMPLWPFRNAQAPADLAQHAATQRESRTREGNLHGILPRGCRLTWRQSRMHSKLGRTQHTNHIDCSCGFTCLGGYLSSLSFEMGESFSFFLPQSRSCLSSFLYLGLPASSFLIYELLILSHSGKQSRLRGHLLLCVVATYRCLELHCAPFLVLGTRLAAARTPGHSTHWRTLRLYSARSETELRSTSTAFDLRRKGLQEYLGFTTACDPASSKQERRRTDVRTEYLHNGIQLDAAWTPELSIY